MRVALVASLVSPIRPAEANGPHAVIVDLARGLAARGHEATIYAPQGSVADGCRVVEIPVDPAAAGAMVRSGRRPSVAAVRALHDGFARLFARLRADAPDVVSQHAFDAEAFRLAEGLPVLHTLHLPPDDGDVLAAARRSAGRLASVSTHARDAWSAATGRQVALVANGVRALLLPPGTVRPVALVAGRIAPEKGTDTAIRVARRAGLHVVVAGDVYDEGFHRTRVAPLLRPGEHIGPVPRETLFGLMAHASLLLMPIRWDEPFGLVAAEAQMAGCPVVGFRRGALPEVVPHGTGGWLAEPDDEAALLEAVGRVPSLDRTRIRDRARRELGVERMVDGYERELLVTARRATARAS